LSLSPLIQWAHKSGQSDLAMVLQNANRDARYENPAKGQEFKNRVAKEWHAAGGDNVSPDQFRKTYERVCAEFQRLGERIQSELPSNLFRSVFTDALQKAFGDGLGYSKATARQLFQEPAQKNDWTGLGNFFLGNAGEQSVEVRLAGRLKNTKGGWVVNRAVFAAFHDPDGDSKRPDESAFWKLVEQEARTNHGGSTEKAVIWLLGLGPSRRHPFEKPLPPRKRVLLNYPRALCGTCRFPVPPDALLHPLFRPVPPGSLEPAGRTLPHESLEPEWQQGQAGTHEVVHDNERIGVSEIRAVALD